MVEGQASVIRLDDADVRLADQPIRVATNREVRPDGAWHVVKISFKILDSVIYVIDTNQELIV